MPKPWPAPPSICAGRPSWANAAGHAAVRQEHLPALPRPSRPPRRRAHDLRAQPPAGAAKPACWGAVPSRSPSTPSRSWDGAPSKIPTTCWAPGIQQLIRALAKEQRLPPEAWAEAHDLSRYFGRQSQRERRSGLVRCGRPRHQFLAEIVADARRLLRLAGEALDGEESRRPCGRARSCWRSCCCRMWSRRHRRRRGATAKPCARGRHRDGSPRPPTPSSDTGARVRATGSPGTKAPSRSIATARSSWMPTVLDGSAPDADRSCWNRWSGSKRDTGQPVAETLGRLCLRERRDAAGVRRGGTGTGGESAPGSEATGGCFPRVRSCWTWWKQHGHLSGGAHHGRVHPRAGRRQGVPVRGAVCHGVRCERSAPTAQEGGAMRVHPAGSGCWRRRGPTRRAREGGRSCGSGWWWSIGWRGWGSWGWGKRATWGEPRRGANCCCWRRSRTCGGRGTGRGRTLGRVAEGAARR